MSKNTISPRRWLLLPMEIKTRLTGKNEFSHAYRMQKNPGVSLSEVSHLVNVYRENLGRWGKVKFEQIEEDMFCFYTAN